MKFVYRLQHKLIPRINNSLSNVTAELAKAMNCPGYKPKINDGPEFDDVITGGLFLPEDLKSTLSVTSENLIRKNRDYVNANNCYLASIMGDNSMDSVISSYSDKVNYIGKWCEDIDKNAYVYYVVVDGKIRKILFSRPIEFGQATDIFGIINIIEDEGNMLYCQPDEGDVLFDNKEEAEQYINELLELFRPLKK